MGTFGTLDLGLGLTIRSRRNGAFDPVAALFGSGEQGYIIPWLPGTVWKDTARTIPCTAHDDLIACADDISGNGNHFVQANSSKRFRWQTDGARYWALPDVFDDFMSSVATVALSASDKLTIWAGVEKFSDAAAGIIVEASANANTNAGSFYLSSGDAGGRRWSTSSRGTAALAGTQSAYDTTLAPDIAVITATHDIAGDLSTLSRNGVRGTDGTGDKGAGNFGNYTHFFGGRGGTSLFFPGRFYPVIVRGGATTPELIAATNQWINAKTGAY